MPVEWLATQLGTDPDTLLMTVVLVVLAVFAWALFQERDLADAWTQTWERIFGTIFGVMGAIVASLAVGFETLVGEFPELLMGALGLGAIVRDVSVEMYAATILVAFIVIESLNKSFQ